MPDDATAPETGAPATAALIAQAANLRYQNGSMAYVNMGGRANLDPLYNKRFLLQVLRQAGVFVSVFTLTSMLASLLLLFRVSSEGLSSIAYWGRSELFIGLVLAALFWLIPVPALLAQWSLLVQHRGDAAGSAFGHIDAAFRQHQTPLDSLQKKTMSPPGEGRREYLEARKGRFAGYISCFAHGRDLYVGWTFWLKLSPLRWLMMIIGRKFQEWTGRGNDVYQTLRFESARATVAAMHDAVIEGVDAAAANLDPAGPRLITQQAAAFGFDID